MRLEDLLDPINRPAIVHCNSRIEIEDLKKFLIKNCDAFNESPMTLEIMFNGVYEHLEYKEYMNKCSFSFGASGHHGLCSYCYRKFYEEERHEYSQCSHYEYIDLIVAEINYDDFTAFLLEE